MIVQMLVLGVSILLNVQSDGSQWIYKPIGSFSDPGPCDSAVRIRQSVAAACSQGVWLGTAGDMQVVLPCTARVDFPNRVRRLNEGHLIASTPCGLYVIDEQGQAQRLAFPQKPGALDANGRGRAVMAAEEGIWVIWPLENRKRFLVIAEEADLPERLELVGDHVLIAGQRQWVMDLNGTLRQRLSDFGNTVLLDGGRLLTINRQGRGWVGEIGEQVGTSFDLLLWPVEHVKAVDGLGDRALIVTSSRWFLISGSTEALSGALPLVVDPPVPVRTREISGIPWLVVDGVLMKAVRTAEPDKQTCQAGSLGRLFEAALQAQHLRLPERPSCLVAGWMPTVELSWRKGFGYRSGLAGGVLKDLHVARTTYFTVNWVWNLDRAWLCHESVSYEQLRRDIIKQRELVYERLVGLLAAYQDSCSRSDWISVEEIRAHIQMLTSDTR